MVVEQDFPLAHGTLHFQQLEQRELKRTHISGTGNQMSALSLTGRVW